MSFIFAYITNSDKKIAKKIAMNLLKKRIVACANMFPIDSIYWWKNKIEESKEYVLIVKTKKEMWRKLKAEVEKTHPYDTPCITKINVEANKEYEEWLRSLIR